MKDQLAAEARIRGVLANIRYLDWEFCLGTDDKRLFLQVAFDGKCNTTGKMEAWKGRKWFLSMHMTESEIVQTALMAVLAAIEHEAREAFRYKNAAIFGPHFNVNHLVELCQHKDALDIRAA